MKYLPVFISIIICQIVGLLGSLFTSPAIPTWYANLQKPSFNPPNWLFGPAWIALYTLMGISVSLVWGKGINKTAVKTALFIFGAQLVLNVLWSFLFFGLKSPLLAFIEIIFLWFFILLTILSFFRVSKIAGFLLLPYIFWVSFAALLNFYILKLN